MTSSAVEHAWVGQLGDFVVVGVLGTGGSGVVLDARWGHREVALKVMHPQLVATPRARHQFLDEARRLQEISHKGVVKVLAVGELPDGRPYLAMEKLAGPTLASRLAAGALPVAQALGLFEQLASAVQALHDQGLIHRDLKPENVVLVGDAHAVLLDFGIAKELAAPASTTTQDGGVRGTPAYMAPERFFGQPASIATDVYELAVTAYAMLAGSLPWLDCGDPDVRLNPRSLREANVGIPDTVDIEIRRALSTRAQNRPASARELAVAVLTAAGVAVSEPPRMTTQVPVGDPARAGPAWFEQRATPGVDRGQTPLAWAPTARAEARTTRASRSRRRWVPFAMLAVAVPAAAIGWIAWRSDDPVPVKRPSAALGSGSGSGAGSGSVEQALLVASEGDPWKAREGTPAPRPAAEMRREMIAGIARLPADTRSVIALGVAELRADPNLGAILDAAARRPEVKVMFGHSPDCKIGLADVDWIVLGFGEGGIGRSGELVLRGRWTHDQLETCLAALSGGKRVVDPSTGAVRIEGDRAGYWIGHDGPVAVISTRDKASAEHVTALATRTAGPEGVVKALLGTIDPNATAIIAIDAGPKDRIKELDPIPPGADAALWVRVDQGLRGVVRGRFKSEKDAKTAEAYVGKKLAQLKKEAGDMVGTFAVAREGKDVTLDAWVTELTLGLAAGAMATMK